MSSMIQGLQRDALNPGIPVSELLRKTKVIATKLDIQELLDWSNQELNGYKEAISSDELPDYRDLDGRVEVFDPYTKIFKPVIFQDASVANKLSSKGVIESIASIEDIIKSSAEEHDKLFINLSPKTVSMLQEAFGIETYFVFAITRASIVGVVDTVRNTILDWALKLEQEGVSGEDDTFTKKEKEITQHTINITGDFAGTIGTMSNYGDINISQNITEISVVDVKRILSEMRKFWSDLELETEQKTVLENSVEDLEKEIEKEQPDKSRIRELLSSAVDTLENAAGGVIAQGIIKMIENLQI